MSILHTWIGCCVRRGVRKEYQGFFDIQTTSERWYCDTEFYKDMVEMSIVDATRVNPDSSLLGFFGITEIEGIVMDGGHSKAYWSNSAVMVHRMDSLMSANCYSHTFT